jgi:type IX secretion system PorP/SprF family membrane protein
MKARIIIFTALMAAGVGTRAQQLHTSSIFELQSIFHNPAMAGNLSSDMVGLSYRSQWSGISGSPQTATLYGSFDLPKDLIGLSGYLYNDRTGPTSRNGVQLAFAKHLPVNSTGGRISIGIETRMFQFGIDREKLSSISNDPVLAGAGNKFKFDMGFGVAYTTKRLQIGASVSQLIQSKLDLYTGNLSTNAEGRLYRHYYLHGQYRFETQGGTSIIPNFLMVYLPNISRMEQQIGVRVERERVWVGGGWRVNQSYMLSAGFHINKNFSVGYAYDNYLTPISTFTASGGSGGHELILRYNFRHKESTRIE